MKTTRTLGILGGMSWTSTAEYYRQINTAYAEREGGLHSAPLLLHSFDFAQVVALQKAGAWDEAAELLGGAARRLQDAGAGAMLIATNTMHLVAPQIADMLDIPLLHIVDSTGAALKAAGVERVGLIATAFTMEQSFYKDRLRERFGIETIVPEAAERAEVHRVIFDELCRNDIRPEAREGYRAVMAGLVAQGAQGIILGCTEIPLLVGPEDTTVPTFDTTALHAQAAVNWLLDGVTP